jgi:hypothetical protein
VRLRLHLASALGASLFELFRPRLLRERRR